MDRIRLDAIVFDAGTQVRAAISDSLVTEYAERISEGVQFPPVVLFHDGTKHYLADGFHRLMASQRLALRDIAATVQAGTRDDALWFALGANRANGQRLTAADKSHAVRIALKAWPHKMQREIAAQVGCHPSLVSEEYQKTIASGPVLRGRELLTKTKRDAVKTLIVSGTTDFASLAKAAKVSRSVVADVRTEMGLSRIDKSKSAVSDRRDQMRTMAADGHTSRQIADAVSMSEPVCRRILRELGVAVPADKATHQAHRHNAARIVEHIVFDAENLTTDVALIDFDSLDSQQVSAWIDRLVIASRSLNSFIRRLTQEKRKHVEVVA